MLLGVVGSSTSLTAESLLFTTAELLLPNFRVIEPFKRDCEWCIGVVGVEDDVNVGLLKIDEAAVLIVGGALDDGGERFETGVTGDVGERVRPSTRV